MLSNDDHPGLFTFLVGLIVIVFVGVGLSMLVDRRFTYSRNASGTARETNAVASELDQLKQRWQKASDRLAKVAPERKRILADHELALEAVEGQRQHFATLSESRENLRVSIKDLESEFADYREKYRTSAWAAAEGEELGDLTIPGGRVYQDAVITRVTDVGLEIRHKHGFARVQAPDLDRQLRDRFQWDDEKRRARLEEEIANRQLLSRKTAAAPVPAMPAEATEIRRVNVPQDAVEVEKLRAKVRAWNSKVLQVGHDHRRALSASVTGSGTSVPGSLETWQARAERLGGELAKAKSELAVARAALAIESPNDPLLRQETYR